MYTIQHGGESYYHEKPVKLRRLRLYKPDKPLMGQRVKLAKQQIINEKSSGPDSSEPEKLKNINCGANYAQNETVQTVDTRSPGQLQTSRFNAPNHQVTRSAAVQQVQPTCLSS